MAFNWTIIPNYIKTLIWEFNKANDLKENVQFNNEVLSQWHDVDNTAVGNAAGQGLSKQLYAPKGTGVAITGVDDYGGLTGWLTINETIAATSNNVITLDSVNEWRERIIEGHLIFTESAAAQNPLPTQANDNVSGYYSELLGAANVTANITDAWLSISYTQAGWAAPPTVAAANMALFTAPAGPTLVWIYADTSGNLKAKIQNTGGAQRFVQIYGRISVSPEYPT